MTAALNVLVTAPKGRAHTLLASLQQQAFSTQHYPAFEIEFLAPSKPSSGADFYIVTSPNAIAGAVLANLPLCPHTPYFTVGDGSSLSLKKHGAQHIYTPLTIGAEGLLAIPELQNFSGKHCWLITGKGGRGLLEVELPKLGISFSRVTTYQRIARIEPESLAQCFRPSAPDCTIVSSAEALHNVVHAATPAIREQLGQCSWVVSSERVGSQVKQQWPHATVVNAQGADDAALSAACRQIREEKNHVRRQ